MTCPKVGEMIGIIINIKKFMVVPGIEWDPREGMTYVLDDGIKGIYIKPTQVKLASDFFLFADSAKIDEESASPTTGELVQRLAFFWDDRDGDSCKGIHIRHNSKGNVWFIDGHVESAGVGRLKELGHDAVTLQDGTVVPLN